jgi:predicted dehydrogenase
VIKVGVVDHHLNNWHANTFLRLLRGPLATEGLEITTAWESDPTGDDWCAVNNVRRAETPEDAVRDADAIFLLAPDNVEDHLTLAQAVLPFGKPTFVDKFLATNVPEAEEIVALAERHGAPLFCASSLRYAVELEAAMPEIEGADIADARFTGIGTWEGYGVHTLALALRVMGCGIERLIDTGTPLARTVTLDYGNGRRSVLDIRKAENQGDLFEWSFAARVGERYIGAKVGDHEGFYTNLMRRCAAFFRTGQSDMPIEEALTVVQVLEAAERSRKAGGEWVPL